MRNNDRCFIFMLLGVSMATPARTTKAGSHLLTPAVLLHVKYLASAFDEPHLHAAALDLAGIELAQGVMGDVAVHRHVG